MNLPAQKTVGFLESARCRHVSHWEGCSGNEPMAQRNRRSKHCGTSQLQIVCAPNAKIGWLTCAYCSVGVVENHQPVVYSQPVAAP